MDEVFEIDKEIAMEINTITWSLKYKNGYFLLDEGIEVTQEELMEIAKQERAFVKCEYFVSTEFLPAIINDDYTGLSENEADLVRKFISKVRSKLGEMVSFEIDDCDIDGYYEDIVTGEYMFGVYAKLYAIAPLWKVNDMINAIIECDIFSIEKSV